MILINPIWCRCTWRTCILMTTHGSHTWRAITNVSTVRIHTTWKGRYTNTVHNRSYVWGKYCTLPFICLGQILYTTVHMFGANTVHYRSYVWGKYCTLPFICLGQILYTTVHMFGANTVHYRSYVWGKYCTLPFICLGLVWLFIV